FVERNGWPKHILRDAMAGLVPDAVRWRKGKQHLGYRFTESLFAGGKLGKDDALRERQMLEPFVKSSALQLFDTQAAQNTSPITRLVLCSIASWLNQVTKFRIAIGKGEL
ncbi:MAG: asparagine synthase-related protein, partial [Novosphingobium sp.]